MRSLNIFVLLAAFLSTTAFAQDDVSGLGIEAQSDLCVTESEAVEQVSLRMRQLVEKELARRTPLRVEVLRPSLPRLLFAPTVQRTHRTESVSRPFGTLYRRHERIQIPEQIVQAWLSEIEAAEHLLSWRRWLFVAGVVVSLFAVPGWLLNAAWTRQKQRKVHERRRIQTARKWAAEGRVVSALGLVNSMEGTAAEFIQRDFDEHRQRFERYVSEAADYIEQQAFAAARDRLDRAREIQAVHPRLVEVEARYRKACRMGTPARPVTEPSSGRAGVPILQSPPTMSSRMILNDTLLVTGHEFVIGNRHGNGVTVPLLANVHRRHAVVERHQRGHRLRVELGCETTRNGELVTAACELVHGDVLQFGPSLSCRWNYLRPIHDSLTVVFEPANTTTIIDIPRLDGSHCRRVVWWDDVLTLAAQAKTPAQVVIAELPVPELRLHREPQGFRVAASEAELSLERGSVEVPLTNDVVSCPCRLIVRVEMSEADILKQHFTSHGRHIVSDHCVLDFQSV